MIRQDVANRIDGRAIFVSAQLNVLRQQLHNAEATPDQLQRTLSSIQQTASEMQNIVYASRPIEEQKKISDIEQSKFDVKI